MSAKLIAYFKMSRLSNLPTVWTNGMAGLIMAGKIEAGVPEFVLLVALSFFYTAGMFLNDACDAQIDAVERNERPIPSGLIGRKEAFGAAFSLLGIANVSLFFAAWLSGRETLLPMTFGALLSAGIVVYDFCHKGNPIGPFLMAFCRFMVYLVSASLVAPLQERVFMAGGILASYLIGLSYTARQEKLSRLKNGWPLFFLAAPFLFTADRIWPFSEQTVLFFVFFAWVAYALALLAKHRISKAVGHMIAGISLWDALLMACAIGWGSPSAMALCAFLATLIAHRWIEGT